METTRPTHRTLTSRAADRAMFAVRTAPARRQQLRAGDRFTNRDLITAWRCRAVSAWRWVGSQAGHRRGMLGGNYTRCTWVSVHTVSAPLRRSAATTPAMRPNRLDQIDRPLLRVRRSGIDHRPDVPITGHRHRKADQSHRAAAHAGRPPCSPGTIIAITLSLLSGLTTTDGRPAPGTRLARASRAV